MNPFEYAQQQHEKPAPPKDRTQGSKTWHNWCLVFVTEAFGVGPKHKDAATAWALAEHKHPETDPRKIPRGVPVFWVGGSSGHGHIALSRGGGTCWSTDVVRDGHVDVCSIESVHAKWGLTLVGWTEDVNGVRVYTPPKPRSERGPLVRAASAYVDRALAAPANKGKARKLHALRKARAWLDTIK